MSIVSRWFNFNRDDIEQRQRWPHMTFASLQDGTASSGKPVSPQTSIASTAVWACVRVIAESVATLPLNVYSRNGESRQKEDGHPIQIIVHDRPNDKQTSVEFREQMLYHLLLYGNAYIYKDLWPSGRVRNLVLLGPDRVSVRVDDSASESFPKLAYIVDTSKQGQRIYSESDILHIRGISSDGLVGISPIQTHRETIGVELAEREFAGRFFGNAARPSGILKVAGKLNPDAASRLKQSWESAHRGLDQAHRVAVLEEGIEWQALTIPLVDAQFLEQRRFSVEEIARIFRVPLHLIGELSRATFSNIEHQAIDFVTHTLRPWCVRTEQALNKGLFFPSEQGTFYVEHVVDALLRGDIQSRYNAYAIARQNGWLSANDVRKLENMNAIEGGDIYLSPLNMVDASTVGAAPATTPAASGSPSTARSIEYRFTCPVWMRENARRGLDWHEQGLSGDGVVERTVREAKAMAAGVVSEDKVVRMAAWFARHMSDLSAPAASPDHPDFPSPGVVAHALWGGGTRSQSLRAKAWAEAKRDQLKRTMEFASISEVVVIDDDNLLTQEEQTDTLG